MISGALYHRVATYSVKNPVWSWSGSATLANPKSQIYSTTKQIDNQLSQFNRKPIHFEIAGGVEEQIGRLQVPVQHIGRMDVLQSSEYLVEEVANVVVAQPLRLQQFVQIRLHQALHNVHVLHLVNIHRSNDVSYVNYLFKQKTIVFSSILINFNSKFITFSCLKRVRILISLSVRWQ